jgi:glycosyl transferase, family 25
MNKCFSEVFLINLDRDMDKLSRVTSILSENQIKFKRFPGIDGKEYIKHIQKNSHIANNITPLCQKFCTPGTIGIYLTHLAIWQKIVDDGIPNALIMEDDVYPAKHANEKIIEYWKEVPEDWDVVYLGCFGACYPRPNDNNIIEYLYGYLGHIKNAGKVISTHVFVPRNPHGMHGYAVSLKGALKLLNIFKKASFHIDMQIPLYCKELNIYAIHPNLIYQRVKMEDSGTADQRPYLLNTLLNHINFDSKGLPMSWRMSIPLGQVFGYPINFWPVFYIVLTYIAKYYYPWLLWVLIFSVLTDLIFLLKINDSKQLRNVFIDIFIIILSYKVI